MNVGIFASVLENDIKENQKQNVFKIATKST